MNLLKKLKHGNGNELARHENGFDAFRREIDRAIERVWRSFGEDKFPVTENLNWPALDVSEDETSITLRVDVPGVEPKDVDVEISGNQLTIRGSRQEETKEEKEGYRRHERRSGSFSRTVTLPQYIDTSKVDAKYDKGVLTVTAPKIPGQGPKRVLVSVS